MMTWVLSFNDFTQNYLSDHFDGRLGMVPGSEGPWFATELGRLLYIVGPVR